jgi:uncharacterized protein
MRQTPVFFPCGELNLSGYIYYPDTSRVSPAVVLCHPHPLHGGSMSNAVIREIGSMLVAKGIIAMMFNFRGVGKSSGEFGGGIGEQEDVRAALNFITDQPQVDTCKIGLCGYSFGGAVAASVGCYEERIKALALISPAFTDPHMDCFETCIKPKFFIIAEAENMISNDTILEVYRNAPQPKELKTITGADHFWSGYEKTLATNIVHFFEAQFIQP